MKMHADHRADAWETERDRQTQELATILNAAIKDYGARLVEAGRQPMVNSVAGALVTVEASILASVPDSHRKLLKKAMEKARPSALAIARSSLATSIVVVGGAIQ